MTSPEANSAEQVPERATVAAAPRLVADRSTPQGSRSWLFIVMGLIALSAVLIGFQGTYVRPMQSGTFKAPAIVHWHGAFAMGWVLLFAVQPWLIRYNAVRVHRWLGLIGVALAIGVAVTMVPAQFFASTRDAMSGGGNVARAMILGAISSAAQFLLLVLGGALYARHGTIHKRLLLLATIVVIWPAWFRWRHVLPWVPNPDLWLGVVLADSLIVVAWLHDRFTRGHIQPVLLNVGVLLILLHLAEVSIIGHPLWVRTGVRVYDALAPWLEPLTR
jgi:hypothetical protein